MLEDELINKLQYKKEKLQNKIDLLQKQHNNLLRPKLTLQSNRDYSSLEAMGEEYISNLDKNKYIGEDLKHYIFEEVIQILYGDTVWEWINSKS